MGRARDADALPHLEGITELLAASWQREPRCQAGRGQARCPGKRIAIYRPVLAQPRTLPKKHGLLMAVSQVSPVTEITPGTLAMSGDIVVTAGGEDATGI